MKRVHQSLRWETEISGNRDVALFTVCRVDAKLTGPEEEGKQGSTTQQGLPVFCYKKSLQSKRLSVFIFVSDKLFETLQ